MLVNFEAVMSPNNALSVRGTTGSKAQEYHQSNNICLYIQARFPLASSFNISVSAGQK